MSLEKASSVRETKAMLSLILYISFFTYLLPDPEYIIVCIKMDLQ